MKEMEVRKKEQVSEEEKKKKVMKTQICIMNKCIILNKLTETLINKICNQYSVKRSLRPISLFVKSFLSAPSPSLDLIESELESTV